MIDDTSIPMAAEAEHASIAEDIIAPPLPIDADAEVERRAEEESSLSVPKHRTGGTHPSVLSGEVGPCTRCGWIWTPSSATVRRHSSGLPRRCANCRSDSWQDAPLTDRARRPGDPEWALRRDTIANRKKRRKLDKLKALAGEFNVELINEPSEVPRLRKPVLRLELAGEPPPPPAPAAIDMTPRLAWQSSRPRTVIPPPPGMEDNK